jgi:hypothetical protein
MSKSAFTLKAFGIYLLVLGVMLIIVPNILLSIFHIPETSEVWIRVVGVLTFNIGIYYVYAARCEAKAYFRASVYTRTFVFLSFTAFAVLGLAKPILILFGAIDFCGGIWTHIALRYEEQ